MAFRFVGLPFRPVPQRPRGRRGEASALDGAYSRPRTGRHHVPCPRRKAVRGARLGVNSNHAAESEVHYPGGIYRPLGRASAPGMTQCTPA